MILQALVKYYEMMAAEDKLPKQGYCTGKVSYALELCWGGGALRHHDPKATR